MADKSFPSGHRTVQGMTARFGSEGGTIQEMKRNVAPASVVRTQKVLSPKFPREAERNAMQSAEPLTR
jgi:hypothetical protein